MFNKSASWYSLSTSNSIPITEEEASEVELIREDEEEDFGTLEESLISLWLSGPNEGLSQDD